MNGFKEIPECCKGCIHFEGADFYDGLYWIHCEEFGWELCDKPKGAVMP